MTERFTSPLAATLEEFLRFKRALGYRYGRGSFTLLQFDRFLVKYVGEDPEWRLDRAIMTWLGNKPPRKAVSVSSDVAVLRGFCSYLQRRAGGLDVCAPQWPKPPKEVPFRAYFLSEADVRRLLNLAAQLRQPRFRASLYRALLLLLYCTGLRVGEALRLRLQDVNTRDRVLFVDRFKGRARWVPFHRSLARELETYLRLRRLFLSTLASDYFFVGGNKRPLSAGMVGHTLQGLFRQAGMKPDVGRVGPRPYDLRHAFAVRRLTLWYRQGVDLQTRLPWLSAYMGHDDILGTQTYLSATPELLAFAARRFRCRYAEVGGRRDHVEYAASARLTSDSGSELLPQLSPQHARSQ